METYIAYGEIRAGRVTYKTGDTVQASAHDAAEIRQLADLGAIFPAAVFASAVGICGDDFKPTPATLWLREHAYDLGHRCEQAHALDGFMDDVALATRIVEIATYWLTDLPLTDEVVRLHPMQRQYHTQLALMAGVKDARWIGSTVPPEAKSERHDWTLDQDAYWYTPRERRIVTSALYWHLLFPHWSLHQCHQGMTPALREASNWMGW